MFVFKKNHEKASMFCLVLKFIKKKVLSSESVDRSNEVDQLFVENFFSTHEVVRFHGHMKFYLFFVEFLNRFFHWITILIQAVLLLKKSHTFSRQV